MLTVPLAGATIGATAEADVVVPAPFLAPVHARIVPANGGWVVESAVPAGRGQVMVRGAAVRQAPIAPGDVFRLADRVGNFVTVKVPAESGQQLNRAGALRGPLPGPGDSYLIGSDQRSTVRLDHPLIQPRHLAVRRDPAGLLWLEDRGTPAGTYLNGQRVRGTVRAGLGDILQVGPYSARIGAHALEPLEQVAGVDIAVRDARVDIAVGKRANRTTRTLLRDVLLHLPPASMTAVAGPSGAGKTTLMRLLSGQQPAAAGTVEYNGADLAQCRQAYAPLMGYVPQEDIVHADLTVQEALDYQARLRLGSQTPAAERDARIGYVLSLLGLTEQRGQLVKTLSGGQRKRVSIACELLSEPQIIFLDEPTSGLDPGLDKRMMLLLRLLADQGRTVVLTTHAIAHVDVCDTLVLVGPGGNVIYAGPPDAALDWFGVQTLGDVFSLVETPDAAAAAARRVRENQVRENQVRENQVRENQVRENQVWENQVRQNQVWENQVRQNQVRQNQVRENQVRGNHTNHGNHGPVQTHPVSAPAAAPGGGMGGTAPPAGSPAWRRLVAEQGKIFASRYVRLIGRDRTALAFSLLQGIAVALLTRLAVGGTVDWSENFAPMFVFGCAAVWFGMIGSVRELVKEKAIWRREFLAGGSMPAYLASKVVVLGAMGAIQALTLTVTVWWTMGLPKGGTTVLPDGTTSVLPAGGPFGHPLITIFLTVWLGALAGMALGLMVSAGAESADRAMSLVPYLLITQLVLCGVLFNLHGLSFISWFMPARWSVSGLGGIAGLSAAALKESSGLYPHTGIGLFFNWIMLLLLAAAGIAAAVWRLHKQGIGWSVGRG
jgi:ABC-type multidrug transport system ATPase subunit/pSer/pThr/pTyr-binding forkhead associated (FHA) protein